MSIPDIALAKIRRFCEHRTPPEFRNQMRLEATSRGNSVTVSDHRPFWDTSDEWVSMKIAQLRYQPETQEWTLYWADSNSRWHRYDDLESTRDLDAVIAEIDEDPTCIFFG